MLPGRPEKLPSLDVVDSRPLVRRPDEYDVNECFPGSGARSRLGGNDALRDRRLCRASATRVNNPHRNDAKRLVRSRSRVFEYELDNVRYFCAAALRAARSQDVRNAHMLQYAIAAWPGKRYKAITVDVVV